MEFKSQIIKLTVISRSATTAASAVKTVQTAAKVPSLFSGGDEYPGKSLVMY